MAPSADQPQLALAEKPAPDTVGPSLVEWARRYLEPDEQILARHHLHILSKLEDVAAGRIDRLMLQLPPGYGKSTLASVIFPAWWFTQHPRTSIIGACHTASLASSFGRRARNTIREHSEFLGYEIKKDERAVAEWRTSNRSEYFACGVRGPITGRRADLVLLDDPVKSREEAESARCRDALWNWYRSDLIPRLKPQGRIILIMTRWHQDDLGGRLLAAGDNWNTIMLPALAQENDALGRNPGEALWPEQDDIEALERKRREVGELAWESQYQQNPKPAADTLFNTTRIQVIDEPPPVLREIRAWDLAGSLPEEGRDPDWTVGLKLAVTKSNQYIVTDIIRIRANPMEIANAVVTTAGQDGASVLVSMAQDPGQAGKQQIEWYKTLLAGYRLRASPETGSKYLRAQPAAATVDSGMLSLVRAPWNRIFLEELSEFPKGRKDDQVDALSRAFSLVAEVPVQSRRAQVPLMAR